MSNEERQDLLETWRVVLEAVKAWREGEVAHDGPHHIPTPERIKMELGLITTARRWQDKGYPMPPSHMATASNREQTGGKKP